MDVGDKRLGVACGMEGGADFTDIVRFAHSLCGQAHIVGACVEDAAALRHAASVSSVEVDVIDCIRIGLSPPSGMLPICTVEE